MSTEHYEGWKLFDKVAVIEKPISESERGHWYTKYPYPQAYICDAKDKKMMATGINWGTWVEYGRDEDGKWCKEKDIVHEAIVNILDNRDFELEVFDSAGGSSQGGKLSFWNCKITQVDRSWIIGISSDILLEILLHNDFSKGCCKQTLCFARKKGSVGMLNENMPSYQQAQNDVQLKVAMNKGKTKTRIPGHCYQSLTQSDVFVGNIYSYYEPIYMVKKTWVGEKQQLAGFRRRAKPVAYYWHVNDFAYDYTVYPPVKQDNTALSMIKAIYPYQMSPSAPARIDAGEFMNLDVDYSEHVTKLIDNGLLDLMERIPAESATDYFERNAGYSCFPEDLFGASPELVDNYELSEAALRVAKYFNIRIEEI